VADDETREDPDRAAILARRQRFIALALGMVGAAACHRRPPQVCLSAIPEPPQEEPHDGDEEVEPPPAEPEPPPPEPARPQPCLNIVLAPTIDFAPSFAGRGVALDDDAKRGLDVVARLLQEHPEIAIEVAGHSDDTGAPARNLELSRRRAEVVRDYLVDHGIAAARMRVQAYGAERPRAPNATDEGRAKNRRVEFSILR
jgi:outer membrane protein OmpA-like peptidoglycan-associated protein